MTARTEFLRAATAVLAAFAGAGLFSSLVPSFLREQLHVHNVAAVGPLVGLLFIVALIAQVAAPERWISGRRPSIGVPHSGRRSVRDRPVDTVTAHVCPRNASGGCRHRPAFRRGIRVAQRLTGPRRRADLLSTYVLFAYTGTIVPTPALGLLDQTIDQDAATPILAFTVMATTLTSALSRPTGATP